MSEIMYRSTRGEDLFTYEESVLMGQAPDGGLLVPQEVPQCPITELEAGHSYQHQFALIKSRFTGETYTYITLREMAENAYSPENFPEADPRQITPVTRVSEGMYIQDLSQGPTAAFKDMAMQVLGQEMDHILTKRGERLTIVGASSGDTVSSWEAAAQGLGRVMTFFMMPAKGMSEFQLAQAGSLSNDRVHNLLYEGGSFDDCQDIVKNLLDDKSLPHLGAVNSINWARISSQIPYYFEGYFRTIEQEGLEIGDEIDFVVPSGNFGNALAGHYARRMGLPIKNIVIATNDNDVLKTAIMDGIYLKQETITTSSPSMDISKASNFERLLFEVFGQDPEKTTHFMERFNTGEAMHIDTYRSNSESLQALGFLAFSNNEHGRLRAIRRVALNTDMKVIIDPHTADGFKAAEQYTKNGQDRPLVIMGTALPVKFDETMNKALKANDVYRRPARFVGLEDSVPSNAFTTFSSEAEFRAYLAKHDQV